MTLQHDTRAVPSISGHYAIQYPDVQSTGFMVPAGETLTPLHWVSPVTGWRPYAWRPAHAQARRVVWVMDLK